MACKGCSGAVERAVKRVEGVTRVEADLAKQSVDVYGVVGRDVVLAAIAKTGKKVAV